MRIAIINLGAIVSGDWRAPLVRGRHHRHRRRQDRIRRHRGATDADDCDVVIDAGGTTAIPGLIDSHVHITFGDYTPRQQHRGLPGKLPAWRRHHLRSPRPRCTCRAGRATPKA